MAESGILRLYDQYEATIGIEVHVQLKTKTKMFCSCANQFGAEPNTNICRVCAGYLGTLPVVNRQAVNYAIRAGLATNCTISKFNEFARKHYMYPDLPKNYQLTQDDKPICVEGYIDINTADFGPHRVRIMRIHMEEDAGKNIHTDNGALLDLNRAGTPLIEIVTHPDIRSADQAVAYLEKLHSIIRYTQVSDANMEEGSFRADVNISVKKKTATKLGTRVEMKNINSFKFIHQAIEFEIERQIEALEAGQKINQETRLWDDVKHETRFMRSKEDALDYRYYPCPDLSAILIDEMWIESIREEMPELADAKKARFIKDYALSEYEADILVQDQALALYFEKASEKSGLPKKVCNWMLRDVLSYLKEHKMDITEFPASPGMLGELVREVEKGVVNSTVAQDVFAEMVQSKKYPSIIIQERGLQQIGDYDQIAELARQVIEQSPNQLKAYLAGNERLFGYFVGQAMKVSGGKMNPQILNEVLLQQLAEHKE